MQRCDTDGLQVSRMDIGRISSEVLLKVAKIRCEIVLSKSSPTELALEMADELGSTALGFIRYDSLNVYAYPERITE